MRRGGRKTYEGADSHAGGDGGHGAGADVAGYPAASGEEAEKEGDLVEGLGGWLWLVSWKLVGGAWCRDGEELLWVFDTCRRNLSGA